MFFNLKPFKICRDSNGKEVNKNWRFFGAALRAVAQLSGEIFTTGRTAINRSAADWLADAVAAAAAAYRWLEAVNTLLTLWNEDLREEDMGPWGGSNCSFVYSARWSEHAKTLVGTFTIGLSQLSKRRRNWGLTIISTDCLSVVCRLWVSLA